MKVIGIGDQVVDKYEHTHMMYPGGNALNFAVFAKEKGVQSAFLGAFGNTDEASHVMESIRELGIDFSHSKHYEGENGHAYVTLKEGDRVFLGSNRCGVLREKGLCLTEEDYQYLKEFRVIHSGLYGFAEKEIQELAKMGCDISFDFSNDFSEEQLARLLPVVRYAFFSASHLTAEERKCLAKRGIDAGCDLVLCTCGCEGAYLYDGQKEYHQESHYVEAKDTMAAGDSFITSFLIDYLTLKDQDECCHEKIIEKSLEQAASFAALQCLKDGSFGYGKAY